MSIVRWVRELLSLPILWLGLLALNFKAGISTSLLTAAWTVGGDPETGRTAVAAIRALKGRDAAREQARAWLRAHPHSTFAAVAGLLALEAGELDEARDMLARGRELGEDAQGWLDRLEYLIAQRSENTVAVARQFAARTDLPADLSKAAQSELMFDDLLSGRFDGAKSRAERLLDIADDPASEMVLWALATRAGEPAEAQKHFDRADVPPAQKSYYGFLCSQAVGSSAAAGQFLADLRNRDEPLALRAVGLLKSRESPHGAETDADVPAGLAGGDHGA